MSSRAPVVEIFGPTAQGEGLVAGLRTMFVRFGGCDGVSGNRDWCNWCDSMHAVNPVHKPEWVWMDADEIKERLYSMAPWCQEVTLSGGNPALHDLSELVEKLDYFGYSINVETQGTFFRDWLVNCDLVTISPKPPSAGDYSDPGHFVDFFSRFMATAKDKDVDPAVCVKVVVDVSDARDMVFARTIFEKAMSISDQDTWVPLYLSVETDPADTRDTLLDKYRKLVEQVAMDKRMPDVHILPQLHVLLWGHKLGV